MRELLGAISASSPFLLADAVLGIFGGAFAISVAEHTRANNELQQILRGALNVSTFCDLYLQGSFVVDDVRESVEDRLGTLCAACLTAWSSKVVAVE